MCEARSPITYAGLVLLFTFTAACHAGYSGGSGTEAEPFRISAVSDWQELMTTPGDWASHFVLTADIDLNDVPITPVGNDANHFTGVFDGNDHIIRNVDVNMPGSDYVGLFGYLHQILGTNGQIRNLGVEDVSIGGRDHVGGLLGWNLLGAISNCYSTGSVSGTGYGIGGLMGYNLAGAIRNCYSTGSVGGDRSVGGLVGYNQGTITNCYSTGSVGGTGSYVGGLVGQHWSSAISNCYSTGSVSGDKDVGGLAGWNHDGTISNCYSRGSVGGTYKCVGGLVGENLGGAIKNCYSTGSVAGEDHYVGGLVGENSFGAIRNCYSTGSVGGTSYVGGLVGVNYYDATISNCYSTGSVGGTSYVGGLLGDNYLGTISSSFWDVNTSGWPTSAGGTPKTTEEMMTQSTFTPAEWDFIGETGNGSEDIWAICEGTNYPRFVWQIPAADWICPDGVGLEDFSYLGGVWGSAGPDPANLDGEDGVRFGDLMIFCEEWLTGR